MPNMIGGIRKGLDFENLLKPVDDQNKGLSSLIGDQEQVREHDADAVDVDGRRVDAGKTAINNLKAIRQKLGQAILPTYTLDTLARALRDGVSLPEGVICLAAGIAMDALKAVAAPVEVVKDGVEAVRWGVVSGVRHLVGKAEPKPMPPFVGDPPDIDSVNLRSEQTGRSGYFQYALKDGRIWTKYDPVLPDKPFEFKLGEPLKPGQAEEMLSQARGPYDYSYNSDSNSITVSPKPDAASLGYKMVDGCLEQTDLAEASSWHLHDFSGGPVLPEGQSIVKIQVAGDFIEAVSDTNQIYRYDPTKPDCCWKAEVGCPFKDEVYLPGGIRDWTLGEAVTVKPKRNCLKSMNPYTDIVGHFEDARGRKGDFNFVATTGVLSANGREIRYRDTGLAADFARGFLTPHHGEFEADKVRSAGSTWFVCGTEPDGKPGIYTRMYDYEINGACPGQRYTYDDTLPFDPDKNHSFAKNEPLMPLPGWAKVDFPELGGQAKVTDCIDILPTGQGNGARELRIEGQDIKGITGYYKKSLEEKEWTFVATNEPLRGKEIKVGVVDPHRVSAGPVTLNYDSATWGKDMAKAPISNISLDDFHPFQTPDQPSTVTFTLTSGQKVPVTLHTVDGYTFYNIRPEDADKQAQGAGVPKVVTGTFVIPDEVKNSSDPEVKAFVEKYLQPLDRQENQLMLIADQDGVRMTSSWYNRHSDHRFDWSANPDYDITFKRDATGESYFEQQVAAAKLEPRVSMDRTELADLSERCKHLKTQLTSEMKERKRDHKLLWARAQVTELAMRGLGLGISALNLSETVNHAATVTQLMPPLFDAHEKAHRSTAFKTPAGYTRAIEQLNEHIAKAEAMIAETNK